MERLINAKEIIENYTNREILTYLFISGDIKAYHKNTIEPIDGKSVYTFFQEFRETFKKENIYYFNNKHRVHKDPRTGVYYRITGDEQEVEKENFSWMKVYLDLQKIPEWAEEDEEFYDYFTEGYPLYWKVCEEIENWWGLLQAEQIVFESLFKEREVIDIFCNQHQQSNKNQHSCNNDIIGDSERETWLKVILLLSYSLAIELQGDESDILNKKGRKKINPDKLASFLKIKAEEMFGDKDNPGHRCGKTTIDNILAEAEKKLSPDIHTFLSPQA